MEKNIHFLFVDDDVATMTVLVAAPIAALVSRLSSPLTSRRNHSERVLVCLCTSVSVCVCVKGMWERVCVYLREKWGRERKNEYLCSRENQKETESKRDREIGRQY